MRQKIKILIVEDEAILAMLLTNNFQLAGYDVCNPVSTGLEAIQVAREARPDVVLMDIRLAGEMDGIQAAREITALHDIPIIFMTGYSDTEIVSRAETLNPAAYLVKPVTPEHVEPVLAELFDLNSAG